jgi:beta-lactamase superfamily II metal-dependent hydrolase
MARKPKELELRSYNVGFGDCFLLSFVYSGDEKKHVLIDFGSTKPPDEVDEFQTKVAKDIEEVTGGKLDAVVATHRHKDHISGFATNKAGTASGNIIRKLADAGGALVIQPWTEDPDAPKDSRGSKGAPHRSKKAMAFTQQLDAMHAIAATIANEASRFDEKEMDATPGEPMARAEVAGTEYEPDDDQADDDNVDETVRGGTVAIDFAGTTASKALKRRIAFIGQDNVKNLSAVQNLIDMSTKKQHRYVFFGADSGLGEILPGVKVHVFGPPTIGQYEAVQKQRSKDDNEFWMLRLKQFWKSRQNFWSVQSLNAQRLSSPASRDLFPKAKKAGAVLPRESRWFVRRLRGARAKQLLELVTIMDDALNNTSVILLFEVGGKKLLFPGDAQIENWEYALNHPDEKQRAKIAKLLADTDVYKVGHHGSRNATPRSLWNLFAKRSKELGGKKMMSFISTKAKVHGAVERHTEVPRDSLVQALKKETEYHTTQDLRKKLVALETIPL